MEKNCILFYNKKDKKEYCRISFNGLFPGEINSTAELLAFEHSVDVSDIAIQLI